MSGPSWTHLLCCWTSVIFATEPRSSVVHYCCVDRIRWTERVSALLQLIQLESVNINKQRSVEINHVVDLSLSFICLFTMKLSLDSSLPDFMTLCQWAFCVLTHTKTQGLDFCWVNNHLFSIQKYTHQSSVFIVLHHNLTFTTSITIMLWFNTIFKWVNALLQVMGEAGPQHTLHSGERFLFSFKFLIWLWSSDHTICNPWHSDWQHLFWPTQ